MLWAWSTGIICSFPWTDAQIKDYVKGSWKDGTGECLWKTLMLQAERILSFYISFTSGHLCAVILMRACWWWLLSFIFLLCQSCTQSCPQPESSGFYLFRFRNYQTGNCWPQALCSLEQNQKSAKPHELTWVSYLEKTCSDWSRCFTRLCQHRTPAPSAEPVRRDDWGRKPRSIRGSPPWTSLSIREVAVPPAQLVSPEGDRVLDEHTSTITKPKWALQHRGHLGFKRQPGTQWHLFQPDS